MKLIRIEDRNLEQIENLRKEKPTLFPAGITSEQGHINYILDDWATCQAKQKEATDG